MIPRQLSPRNDEGTTAPHCIHSECTRVCVRWVGGRGLTPFYIIYFIFYIMLLLNLSSSSHPPPSRMTPKMKKNFTSAVTLGFSRRQYRIIF